MNQLKGAIYLTCASTVWGGMCVVGKYTTTSVSPLTLVFLRFLVASLALGIVVHRHGIKLLLRKDVPRVVVLGFIGCTVSIGTQFMGIHWSSAHMAAVLTATTPIFIALMAPMLLRERVSPKDCVSLVVASFGMLLTTVSGTGAAGGSEIGNVFLLVAAASWGVYSVLTRPLNAKYGAEVVLFWSILFGTLCLLPFTAVEIAISGLNLPRSGLEWSGVVYLGVFSTAIAFFCWNKGFELLPPQVAGLFQFVQPVVGSLLALVLLHEQMAVTFIYGSILILFGVALSLSGAKVRLQMARLFGRLRQHPNGSGSAKIKDGFHG